MYMRLAGVYQSKIALRQLLLAVKFKISNPTSKIQLAIQPGVNRYCYRCKHQVFFLTVVLFYFV